MAAPIPDNAYGGPVEETNRVFVATRGNKDKFPRKSKRQSKRKKHRGAKRY